jgi:hypothetical protein
LAGWGLWVLVPVVVGLLAGLGAAGGSFIAREEARARSTPSPAMSRSPSVRLSPARQVTLRLPESLLNRAKTTDKGLLKTAEQAAKAQRAAEANAQVVLATYYGTQARKNLMFVLVVQKQINDVPAVASRVYVDMEKQQPGLDLTAVDPGGLGGEAACGDASVTGTMVTFCVWVDSGSYGFVEFFGARVNPVQFVRARAQIELLN